MASFTTHQNPEQNSSISKLSTQTAHHNPPDSLEKNCLRIKINPSPFSTNVFEKGTEIIFIVHNLLDEIERHKWKRK